VGEVGAASELLSASIVPAAVATCCCAGNVGTASSTSKFELSMATGMPTSEGPPAAGTDGGDTECAMRTEPVMASAGVAVDVSKAAELMLERGGVADTTAVAAGPGAAEDTRSAPSTLLPE